MEFEKVFPELCTFGRYQKLIYFLVLLPAQLSYYCHVFSHLFLTYQPPHWCRHDHLLAQVVDGSHSPTSRMTGNANQTYGSLDSSNVSAPFLSQSLQANEVLRRFFFIPSRHVVMAHNDASQDGRLNMSRVLADVQYSLLDYVDSLSSCSLYNASSDELVRFHQRFLQLFSLLSQQSATMEPRSATALVASPPIVKCDEWTYNQTWLGGDHSIVTKWNLVCHQEWLQLVPLSALLLGLFFGFPLYYILCHSLGYRRTYFAMLLCQCAAGTLSAFVHDLKHFCLLRFVIGLSLATIVIVPTDLMVETSGVRVMGQIALYNEAVRLIGALLCGLVAYFIHDFRHLSAAISLPFAVLVFLWWSFPESTNYLLVTGQIARLEKYILDIAHTNLRFIDPEFDESVKRRIYTELAIYREFMISSLMQESFGGLDKYLNHNASYIDFNTSGARDPVLMVNSNNLSPLAKDRNEPEQQVELQESSLAKKLIQHLESKERSIEKAPKSPDKVGNGHTVTPPEIWSEAESDSEANAGGFANGHLKNEAQRASLNSSSSSSVGKPTSLSDTHISALSNCAFKERTSLLTVLRLPNMRRKFLVLLFLSMTHFSLYVSFTYFIADFLGNPLDRKLHESPPPSSLFHLFAFAVVLNLIAVLLTWLCLRFKFGRKVIFLSASLLASIFTLFTGILLGSPVASEPALVSSSRHAFGMESWKQQVNASLVVYSIAKVFQASTYLVLLIWLYELLPPFADCSVALRACFTLPNLQLLFMPLLLYGARKSIRLTIPLPDVLVEALRRSGPVGIPPHYFVCALLLFLSTALCLLLPETGSSARLPCSLQEAELFAPVSGTKATVNSGTVAGSRAPPKWYSLKVLFNFRPPNIRPVSGILKKPPAIAVKQNGKIWNGKRKFLLDASLEQKFANMSKDCANQTALNSVYNQFFNLGSAAAVPAELDRHQSAPWMSAVADAAATGVPLFVPVPSPTHIASSSKASFGGPSVTSAARNSGQVSLEHQQRLQHQPHHSTATPSHKGSVNATQNNRRHSMHHPAAAAATEDDHYHHQQHHSAQHQASFKDAAKELAKTGSHAELSYMATVMDLPYYQHRFQSLPRVHPLPPLEVWDDLHSEEQIAQWLSGHTAPWNGDAVASALTAGQSRPGAVRVLDIVDTNNGVSGQIDTYLEHQQLPESSYFAGDISHHFASLDDDVNFDVDTPAAAFVPLDI